MTIALIAVLIALKLITLPMAVSNMAAQAGVDPRLAACVVEHESAWNIMEVSTSNAQGLFQIMPSTAEWVAGKMGLVSYDLTNPVDNMSMGLWILDRYPEWYSTLPLCADD